MPDQSGAKCPILAKYPREFTSLGVVAVVFLQPSNPFP